MSVIFEQYGLITFHSGLPDCDAITDYFITAGPVMKILSRILMKSLYITRYGFNFSIRHFPGNDAHDTINVIITGFRFKGF